MKDEPIGALVIIESPYAGDIERNTLYARRAMRDSLDRGENPIASHLIYTQPGILDEFKPEERKRGIEAGFAWWVVAEKVVFYSDYSFSKGMVSAMERAQNIGKPTEIRLIGINQIPPETEKTTIQLADDLDAQIKRGDIWQEETERLREQVNELRKTIALMQNNNTF